MLFSLEHIFLLESSQLLSISWFHLNGFFSHTSNSSSKLKIFTPYIFIILLLFIIEFQFFMPIIVIFSTVSRLLLKPFYQIKFFRMYNTVNCRFLLVQLKMDQLKFTWTTFSRCMIRIVPTKLFISRLQRDHFCFR